MSSKKQYTKSGEQRSPWSVLTKPQCFHTFSVILTLLNYRKCMKKSRWTISVNSSLRKHLFLLALRCWGRFARTNDCDSATEIPYWWHKIIFTNLFEVKICAFHNNIISTPFAVHYEKIRSLLRETATNSAKIHSLTWKYEHLRINQIQLRFLHFNQHSTTLLGIHMRHWAYKREKYTFIKANIKVINTILKVTTDNWHTLKCKHYSLTFLQHCLQFNSIPGQP